MSKNDANHYIETQRGDRPWLNSARHARPEVQQVFAALDHGKGHAHIRHEGWLSPEKSQLRVQYMQDPAQLDPIKRVEGEDGLLPGDKKHFCGAMSTAIRDPSTFAVAFTRGIDHPNVRRALETPFESGRKPDSVTIPIRDLLGPEGHQQCEGYRLVGDTSLTARQDRKTWLRETRAGETPSVPSPLLAPLDFRGGTIEFRFTANQARTGYEVLTMFPGPLDREPEHP